MVMSWREPNRARWVGVRPGHDGDMLVKAGTAVNGTTIVYTVPVGKVLLVVAFTMYLTVGGAGAVTGFLNRAGEDAFCLGRLFQNTAAGWQPHVNGNFPIPFELDAGDTVSIVSSAVTITGGLTVFGILMPG